MFKQSEHWDYKEPLAKLVSTVETCLVNKTNLIFIHSQNDKYHCLVVTEKGVEYVGELTILDDTMNSGIFTRKLISDVFQIKEDV